MVTYNWLKFDITLLVWSILFTFDAWMVTMLGSGEYDRGQPRTQDISHLSFLFCF